MIIKLVRKIIYQPNDDKMETKEETTLYDGFDRVVVSSGLVKNMEHPFAGTLVDCFTQDSSERILDIMLFRKDEFFRRLYIDYCYSVYLMSNEGKTIERIN